MYLKWLIDIQNWHIGISCFKVNDINYMTTLIDVAMLCTGISKNEPRYDEFKNDAYEFAGIVGIDFRIKSTDWRVLQT